MLLSLIHIYTLNRNECASYQYYYEAQLAMKQTSLT